MSDVNKYAALAAGAAAVATTVTPEIRTWYLAGPLWIAAAAFAFRWWVEQPTKPDSTSLGLADLEPPSAPPARPAVREPSEDARAAQQRQGRPAHGPELILRYEPSLFSALEERDIPKTPLLIQNAGDRPARAIEIDPVYFHGYVARFFPPTELIQNEPAREVRVAVTSTDDPMTQGDTLGFALDHDLWHRAWKGDTNCHPRWSISLRYRDAVATAYEEVFQLSYNHKAMRVTLELAADAAGSSRATVAERLLELHRRCVHEILNVSAPLDPNDREALGKQWIPKAQAWDAEVVRAMKEIGCKPSEVHYVETFPLGQLRQTQFLYDMNSQWSICDMRRERLEKVIDGYLDRPIFTS